MRTRIASLRFIWQSMKAALLALQPVVTNSNLLSEHRSWKLSMCGQVWFFLDHAFSWQGANLAFHITLCSGVCFVWELGWLIDRHMRLLYALASIQMMPQSCTKLPK